MIKQILLLAGALSAGQLAFGAACSSTSLAAYIALGSSGCTIGGDTFSNFAVVGGTTGGNEVLPASVNISVTGSTYTPTLTLSTTQAASGGTPDEVIFTYDISGQLYTGISATLGSSSVTADGGVTGLVNFCEGAAFGADGFTCTKANNGLGTLATLPASDDELTDSATFPQVSLLGVTDDLIIDPGLSGTANGGTLTNSFTAVPEPVSSLLAGLGLAGILSMRKKLKGVF